MTNELTEEFNILKEKETINNCSDFCFYEFNKIKENKEGCELDCSRIKDQNNDYYQICY